MPYTRYPSTKQTGTWTKLEYRKKGKWSRPRKERIYHVGSLQERALEDVSGGGGGELALHLIQAILHLAHHLQSARGAAADAPQERGAREIPRPRWDPAQTMRQHKVTVRSNSNDPVSASNWLDPGMREEMPDSPCCSRWRPWLPACLPVPDQRRSHDRYTELQREALWWRGSACLVRSCRWRSSAQLRASRRRRCLLVRSPLSTVRREKDGGRKENGELGFGVSGGRRFYSKRGKPWPSISVQLRSRSAVSRPAGLRGPAGCTAQAQVAEVKAHVGIKLAERVFGASFWPN
jgi:hypothetical protein